MIGLLVTFRLDIFIFPSRGGLWLFLTGFLD